MGTGEDRRKWKNGIEERLKRIIIEFKIRFYYPNSIVKSGICVIRGLLSVDEKAGGKLWQLSELIWGPQTVLQHIGRTERCG